MTSPGLALRPLFPPPSRSRFLPEADQGVHDIFVRLETRVGHVHHRREEDIKQEGREHATLPKTLIHGEPPRAHVVVEPHTCPHAVVELTDDRNHPLRHAEAGEYCPQEWSVDGVVRFGGIRLFRANSCSRRITNIMSGVERFGRKPLWSSGRTAKRSQ